MSRPPQAHEALASLPILSHGGALKGLDGSRRMGSFPRSPGPPLIHTPVPSLPTTPKRVEPRMNAFARAWRATASPAHGAWGVAASRPCPRPLSPPRHGRTRSDHPPRHVLALTLYGVMPNVHHEPDRTEGHRIGALVHARFLPDRHLRAKWRRRIAATPVGWKRTASCSIWEYGFPRNGARP